jgi:hypothetical protein
MELTPKSISEFVLFLVLLDSYLQYFHPDSFTALTYPLTALNGRDDIVGTLRSDTSRIIPDFPIVDPGTQPNSNVTSSLTLPDNTSLAVDEIQRAQPQEHEFPTDLRSEDNTNNSQELEEVKQEEDNYAAGDHTPFSTVCFFPLHRLQLRS